MDTKLAVKIGVTAGLISALFPSIPTIVKMEYYKEKWFWVYTIGGIALVAAILMW